MPAVFLKTVHYPAKIFADCVLILNSIIEIINNV